MSYHLYFVNHTKKQIVDSKRTGRGLEIADVIGVYLSYCKGDTIEVIGEEAAFLEKHVYDPDSPKEYKVINLYDFQTEQQENGGWQLSDTEQERLRAEVDP